MQTSEAVLTHFSGGGDEPYHDQHAAVRVCHTHITAMAENLLEGDHNGGGRQQGHMLLLTCSICSTAETDAPHAANHTPSVLVDALLLAAADVYIYWHKPAYGFPNLFGYMQMQQQGIKHHTELPAPVMIIRQHIAVAIQ